MSLVEMLELEPIIRLSKDIREAAVTLSRQEARYLVDSYYTMQDQRKRSANQVRAMSESGEPCSIIAWYLDQSMKLEGQVKRALDAYSQASPVGEWSRSITGIGPVIAAGLLAHIDIERCPTVGHIWAFAGLDPTRTWAKGQKRPHNAALKTLCWKIGESFVKVSGLDSDIYGKHYIVRKDYEQRKNEAGDYADQAAKILETKKIGKDTEAFKHYSAGKLPPAQIHARAKRWAVKLFLSHWHDVAYRDHFGTEPPLPYPIAHLGHVHRV